MPFVDSLKYDTLFLLKTSFEKSPYNFLQSHIKISKKEN